MVFSRTSSSSKVASISGRLLDDIGKMIEDTRAGVAATENASWAEQFIAGTCDKQGIIKDRLIIHADRGASIKAKLVAELMADLGNNQVPFKKAA